MGPLCKEEIKGLDEALATLLSKLHFIDFVEDDLCAPDNPARDFQEQETDEYSFHHEIYNPKAYFVFKLVRILSSLLTCEQYDSSAIDHLSNLCSNLSTRIRFKKGETYIDEISSTISYSLRNILLDSSSSKSNISFAFSSLLSKLEY